MEIINGRFAVTHSNTLTPERAAALERSYLAGRREVRRRIDAKFNTRSDSPQRRSVDSLLRRFRVQNFRSTRKPSLAEFGQMCDALLRRMERLAARQRRNRMLRDILD